jgi:PAS domain S-box-containing protein
MANHKKSTQPINFSNPQKGLVPLLQQAIFRSTKHFTSILKSLHDGILFYGNSLMLVTKNEEVSQLVEKCKPDNCSVDEAEREFLAGIQSVLEKVADEVLCGRIVEKELLIFKESHVIRLTFYPLDDAGVNVGIAVGLKDITAQRNSEKLLFYEAALTNNVTDAFISTDLDFRIRSFNKAAENMYGLKAVEVIGKYIFDVIPVKFEDGSFEDCVAALQSENKYTGVACYTRKDGKKIILEGTLTFILNEAGEKTGIVGIIRDITEKRQLQEKVKSFDNYILTILNSTSEAIFLLDTAGNIKLYNEYSRELILHFTGSDISKIQNLVDALPEFRKPEVASYIQDVSKGQIKEYEVLYPSGKWLQVYFLPVYNHSNNTINEICCTIKDITDRKTTEEKIKKSEEMYRSFVEAMMEGVVYQSHDLKNNMVNNSAAKILGLPKEKIIQYGLKIPDLVWVNQKEQPIEVESIFCNNEEPSEPIRGKIIGLKKNESIRWLYVNAEPVKIDDTGNIRGCVFTFTDITEPLKTREELNLLSKVVKETSNLVVITDVDENIIWANDSFIKISEYKLEELMNRKPGWLLGGPEKDAAEISKIRTALKNGEPVKGEILNYSKTGKKYWVNYNIHPVRDEDGKLVKFFSIQSDITELKKIREEMVYQKMEYQSKIAYATLKGQEEKQTQIGQELHDNVNQILAAAKLYLGFVLNNIGNSQENISFSMNNIQLAIDEIRKLSHQLVAPRFKEKNLTEVLEELAKTVPASVSVHLSTSQLNESKINPDIKLTLYRIAQEQLNNIGKYAQAKHVFLTVQNNDHIVLMNIEDDGVGFDPSQKKNGIGITNIYNRVESLYGRAEIISAPGKGCKLNVLIPHSQDPKAIYPERNFSSSEQSKN